MEREWKNGEDEEKLNKEEMDKGGGGCVRVKERMSLGICGERKEDN